MATGEAAAYIGVSIATLRRWCAAGKVPHWRTPGGQRRFDKGELDGWLTEMKRPWLPVESERQDK